MKNLAERAVEVLRANDRGTFTVPSPGLYPHQWAWDSGFIAVGWSLVDPGRALTELEALVEGQWEDGRIPHIRFRSRSGSYFPGPEIWGTGDSTSITQPPVWTSAALRLLERGADPSRLRALLPALERSHLYFYEHRDPLGWNLVAVAHPWESGMDNLPAWDEPLQAVDPSRSPPLARVDREKVADASQRPSDDHYRCYLSIVRSIAESGYGMGVFAVYDPATTALLIRAEENLDRLGRELGYETAAAERAARLRQSLLDRLWDPGRARFRYYDARARRWLTPDVLGAYLPLMLELPPEMEESAIRAIRKRYWTEWPLPSTAPGEAGFQPVCYWRGPSWVHMNWLLAQKLGRDLVERTLEMVDRFGFYEYYHPHTGEGLGASQFAWTAALTLDLLGGSP